MFSKIKLFLSCFYLLKILIKDNCANYLDSYNGEHFPPKYLVPDDIAPTMDDLHHYVKSLQLLLEYCSQKLNTTDVNQALGVFYTKSLLKRSLQDYSPKINKALRLRMKSIIDLAETLETHYIYKNAPYGMRDLEFRVSRVFADDEPQVYSIKTFNRHRLIKWILSRSNMHNFSREMDNLALPRESMLELAHETNKFYIRIPDSDTCISQIIYNPIPINLSQLSPCKVSKFCSRVIFGTPSVGYSLSHRLLNMMLPHHTRRCYIRSPERDMEEMDRMCAFMYREAVYVARRGFFARDLFLEHLALCSFLGYEEFHRRYWYRKAASWIDEEGCMAESYNFHLNLTKLVVKRTPDPIKARNLYVIHRKNMLEECHSHPMALLKIVMSHAIRHALHYLSI